MNGFVAPAKAGAHFSNMKLKTWIPAFAGMTMLLLIPSNSRGDVIPRSPENKPVAKSSATTGGVAVSTEPTGPIELRNTPNNAFTIGEKLTFAIQYEFINAGTATMEIMNGPILDGRPTLHIETKAQSNGFVDKFFKVRDFNASIMDRGSLMSRNFHQNLKEGGYAVIRNTAIDYKTRSYKFSKVRHEHLTERTGKINEPLHDILSAFYYTRTLDLKPGQNYSIRVFSDEDTYSLGIKIAPRIERIKVPAGDFDCLRVEPAIIGDGIFKAEEDAQMVLWLTNDALKIPVLIRSKVFIGSFDAELIQHVTPTVTVFDTPPSK